MNRLSNTRRCTPIRGITLPRVPVDRVGKTRRRVSLSRWRALEHDHFRALVAAPEYQDRSNGGSRSC